eukprot:NODE_380_length_8387_cov_0.529440.p6 type:complete len:103 gc:universal NODE_380_length_8387_cov_0.529440:406-98(-)
MGFPYSLNRCCILIFSCWKLSLTSIMLGKYPLSNDFSFAAVVVGGWTIIGNMFTSCLISLLISKAMSSLNASISKIMIFRLSWEILVLLEASEVVLMVSRPE